MLIQFRQGLVQVQSPSFFKVTFPYVDLMVTDTNTIVAFAAGTKDYLYTEQSSVTQAWGPLHLGRDQWLYWDIDVRTGRRSFGITLHEPVISNTAPNAPTTDQHWFDLSSGNMMIWAGHGWSKRIRTFAMKLINGRIPVSMCITSPTFTGTQIGVTGPTYAGHIMFDATTENALRDASGGFITTEDRVSTKSVSLSEVKLASIIIEGESQQNMAAHTVVVFSEFGKIVHADQYTAENTRHFGMIETSAVTGQTVQVTHHGMISSPDWDFSAVGVNALLYCDAAGALTTVPVIPNQIPIGEVLDKHTIILGSPIVKAEGGADVALATQSVFGISRLSVPAEDEADPIVVGDNDPRLTNARPPAYHTHPIDQVIQLTDELDNKVNVTGDTMTGFLTLVDDPIEPLHAATKQYVDNRTVSAAGMQYQVQYNMAGEFAASNALSFREEYAGSRPYALLDVGSSNFDLAVVHSPIRLQIEAGGIEDALAYALVLAGGSSSGTGSVVGEESIRAGDVIVRGGWASSNTPDASFGGDAIVTGGTGFTKNGNVIIRGGEQAELGTNNSFANGGNVTISGGSVGNTHIAGDVIINGGTRSPGGTSIAGNIRLNSNGQERLRISNTGEWILNGTSAGAPGQVLVSQGADQPPTWGSANVGLIEVPINTLLPATNTNFILNSNYSQTWVWGNGTTVSDSHGLRLISYSNNDSFRGEPEYVSSGGSANLQNTGNLTSPSSNVTFGNDPDNYPTDDGSGTLIPAGSYYVAPYSGDGGADYDNESTGSATMYMYTPAGLIKHAFRIMFATTDGSSTINGGACSISVSPGYYHEIDPANNNVLGQDANTAFDSDGFQAGIWYTVEISRTLYNMGKDPNATHGSTSVYDITIYRDNNDGSTSYGPSTSDGASPGTNQYGPVEITLRTSNQTGSVLESAGNVYTSAYVAQQYSPSLLSLNTSLLGHDALTIRSDWAWYNTPEGAQTAFNVTSTGRTKIGGHLMPNSVYHENRGVPGAIRGEADTSITTLIAGGQLLGGDMQEFQTNPYNPTTVLSYPETGTVCLRGGDIDETFGTTIGQLIDNPDRYNIIAHGGSINVRGSVLVDAKLNEFEASHISSISHIPSIGGAVEIAGGDTNPFYNNSVGGSVHIRGGIAAGGPSRYGTGNVAGGIVLLESGGVREPVYEFENISAPKYRSSIVVADDMVGFAVGSSHLDNTNANNEDFALTRNGGDPSLLQLLIQGNPGESDQVLTSGGSGGAIHWADVVSSDPSLDGVTGYPITALGIGAGTNVRVYAPSNSPWGGESTAIGTNSMNAVTNASSGNVALGTDSLRYSTRATFNTALGTRSLATINDSITGTTAYAGPQYNTAVGFRTLEAVGNARWYDYGTEIAFSMVAAKNVHIGSNAGCELMRATGCVAVGYSAMRSGSSMFNVAIGSEAMRFGTNISTESSSTQTREVVERAGDIAIGPNAMRGAAVAYDYTLSLPGTRSSVAIGMNSMSNKVAQSSVAIGYATLQQTTQTAVNSVAVGVSALQLCTSGVNNTAVGYKAGMLLLGGVGNTALGYTAGQAITHGNFNTCLGNIAGNFVTTGSNNVLVGYAAGADAVGTLTTQSNYVIIGNNNTTNANIKVAWTVTSDARDKTEIAPISVGLDFINQLAPKQFKLMDRETQQATTGIRYGFLAQDVLVLEGSSPVIVDDTDADNLKMRESLIVPALVKAVQELAAEVALLKQQLSDMAAKI